MLERGARLLLREQAVMGELNEGKEGCQEGEGGEVLALFFSSSHLAVNQLKNPVPPSGKGHR